MDVLIEPELTLGLLCDVLDVPFLPEMLSWPPGRRETDGIWAKYWYENVEASTGFAPYRPKDEAGPRAAGRAARTLPRVLRGAGALPGGRSLS